MNATVRRVAVFGETLVDESPDRAVLGGAPFNVAYHLERFGIAPLLVTRVGRDAYGDRIFEAIERAGMDTRGVASHLPWANSRRCPRRCATSRLGFALPAAFRATDSRYRSRLSSVDREWTDWTADATRNYTNLPDGESGFALEARDAFGRVSAMAPMTIAVAPPWFRTRWAKAGYLSSALLALWDASWIGGRRRNRAMQARQRELEALVAGRTQELQQSNAQLADQAERLAEVDRLKTRFFANVGHEFRTPLRLGLRPLEDLVRDTRDRFSTGAREQLEMANRNARRVLKIAGTGNLTLNNYRLGATAPFGKFVGKASYMYSDGNRSAGGDAQQFAICLDYNLSKRTALYSAYSFIDNADQRLSAVGDASNSGAYAGGNGYNLPGVFQQGIQFGLRHMF